MPSIISGALQIEYFEGRRACLGAVGADYLRARFLFGLQKILVYLAMEKYGLIAVACGEIHFSYPARKADGTEWAFAHKGACELAATRCVSAP